MNVYICVGSSCHLKGSYQIIELMKASLEINSLSHVELKAAFCLGKCKDGVTIKVGQEIICGVSKDNFDEIFNKHILGKGWHK